MTLPSSSRGANAPVHFDHPHVARATAAGHLEVDRLQTQDLGPALDRDTSPDSVDPGVGLGEPRTDRQVQFDDVTHLKAARHLDGTDRSVAFDGRLADRNLPQHSALRPGWDPQGQHPRPTRLLTDDHSNRSLRRIARLDVQRDRASVGQDVRISPARTGAAARRRHRRSRRRQRGWPTCGPRSAGSTRPRTRARAARTTPADRRRPDRGDARATLVQRVGVVERRAVWRGRGGDRRCTGCVRSGRRTAVAGGEQQPPGEHHRADAGAGLGVGAVGRQLPIVAEPSSWWCGALAAGQIGAACDRASPTGRQRGEQIVVTVSTATSTAPEAR